MMGNGQEVAWKILGELHLRIVWVFGIFGEPQTGGNPEYMCIIYICTPEKPEANHYHSNKNNINEDSCLYKQCS